MVLSRLCGILLFQDMQSLYGREIRSDCRSHGTDVDRSSVSNRGLTGCYAARRRLLSWSKNQSVDWLAGDLSMYLSFIS